MFRITLVIGLLAAVASGCERTRATAPLAGPRPVYDRPIAPGTSALRQVSDPARMPDLAAAYRHRDANLLAAIDQSLTWFAAPSSRRFFPFEGVTHRRALAGVAAMRTLLQRAPDEASFVDDMRRLFDVYESVGYDGDGIVLFTGYYAPIFPASRRRTTRFSHALYRRPRDLVTDPVTGEPLGRRIPDGGVVPYPTRREITSSRMLAGTELVWLEDALSAYLIHVNGSAKLRLRDGSTLYVGYAGKTDRPYASLGTKMVKAGLLVEGEVTLSGIRQAHREQPGRVERLMLANDNFVFFTEYPESNWPAGSLGVRVTTETSLATDKLIYPRGGVVLVDTEAARFSDGLRPFLRFMLDQDTGGAIRAPGRADIFMGIGRTAEILAGGQYAEGRLYYLLLKPAYVDRYAGRP